jgi:hypothetical protein
VGMMTVHSRSFRTKASLRATRLLMVGNPFFRSDPVFRTQAGNNGVESFI